MGDFNHPHIYWKRNTARCTQPTKFLQGMEDKFLMQVVEEPARTGVLLDLALINKKGLIGDMKAGGTLRCGEHEIVKFSILPGRNKAINRIATLDFRRENFNLFNDLPWKYSVD